VQLQAVARWMLQEQLAGGCCRRCQNSSLRTTLMEANKTTFEGLMQVSDQIGLWIEAPAATVA
jgi:hypothetical protein